MSQIYKIIRWYSVLNTDSITPIPIISIKPDKNFKLFAEANKNILLLKIRNTQSCYESYNGIVAIVDNYNYLEQDTVSIRLNAEWYGYPDCTGDCEIFGLKGGIPAQTINNVALRTIPMKSPMTHPVGMTTETIIGLSVGIVVIFLVTLFLSKK